MILKITRKKTSTSKDKETCNAQYISEFYEGNIRVNHDEMIATINNDKDIPFSDYSFKHELDSDLIEYKTINVYLMNNQGQTIERIK